MKTKWMLFIAIFLTLEVIAQSELPEEYSTLQKVVKKTRLNFPSEGRKAKNGGGYSASLRLMKTPPKKVALVSFFTFDPGLTKVYSYSSTGGGMMYTTTVTKTRGMSHGNAAALVDQFYDTSIVKLVSLFKENGMQLLLPEEFLNTESKKSYFDQFTVPHDKFNDWLKNLGTADHKMVFAWPDGYKPLDVIYEPIQNYSKSGMFSTMDYKKTVSDVEPLLFLDDEKMQNAVGYDLAEALEVDAVLIVYFTIYCPKDTRIVMQNANMIMLGKNPLEIKEGEKKPMFYRKGQFYCATRFQPDVIIFNGKKKKPETLTLNPAGFDNVVLGLATPLCSYLVEGIKKYTK